VAPHFKWLKQYRQNTLVLQANLLVAFPQHAVERLPHEQHQFDANNANKGRETQGNSIW
jgi:hypothetical protein